MTDYDLQRSYKWVYGVAKDAVWLKLKPTVVRCAVNQGPHLSRSDTENVCGCVNGNAREIKKRKIYLSVTHAQHIQGWNYGLSSLALNLDLLSVAAQRRDAQQFWQQQQGCFCNRLLEAQAAVYHSVPQILPIFVHQVIQRINRRFDRVQRGSFSWNGLWQSVKARGWTAHSVFSNKPLLQMFSALSWVRGSNSHRSCTICLINKDVVGNFYINVMQVMEVMWL